MGMGRVVNVRREAYDVHIGRGGRWGNPYRLGQHGNREQVIERYRQLLKAAVRQGRVSVQELAELHGKRLGCYCAPKHCHGHVLVKAAAWANAQITAEGR